MNNILYKYWFFYIKPEYLHLVCTEEDDSLLYAYTDNKEFAKIFQNQRDMDKFFMIKREIKKDEVNYLAKYFTREFLIKKEVKTKSNGIGSKVIDYDLILTGTEFNIVNTTCCKVLMVDIWKSAWTNPYIFKNKYVKMLDKMGLVNRFNILNTWKCVNSEINKMGDKCYPDLLSTFIHEFGFLLNDKRIINMKKIYLIYAKIPSLLFDNKLCNFVKDNTLYSLKNGYYTGLYAWTTKKILLDAFMEFRKGAHKIYKIKTRKLTTQEFNTFCGIHYYEELSYYRIPTRDAYDEEFNSISYIPNKKDSKMDKESFFHKNKDVSQIVCTREEVTELFEYGDQHLHEYMFQVITGEYYAFKDEYKLALDYIGYCDEFNRIHDGNYGTDEEDKFYASRYEMTDYCKSYKLSFYGNKSIDIYDNKVALFIMIYYEMIVGYHEDEEIKLLVYQ